MPVHQQPAAQLLLPEDLPPGVQEWAHNWSTGEGGMGWAINRHSQAFLASQVVQGAERGAEPPATPMIRPTYFTRGRPLLVSEAQLRDLYRSISFK